MRENSFKQYMEKYKDCLENILDEIVDSSEVVERFNIYPFCNILRKVPHISSGDISMSQAKGYIHKNVHLSTQMNAAIGVLNALYADLLGCYEKFFLNTVMGVIAVDKEIDILTIEEIVELQEMQMKATGDLANLCNGVNLAS